MISYKNLKKICNELIGVIKLLRPLTGNDPNTQKTLDNIVNEWESKNVEPDSESKTAIAVKMVIEEGYSSYRAAEIMGITSQGVAQAVRTYRARYNTPAAQKKGAENGATQCHQIDETN